MGDKNRLQQAFEFKKGINPHNLERQQFPPLYSANGAVYITWRKYLRETNSIVSPNNSGFYIMSEEDSLEIDTRMDLHIAEIELEKRRAS